MAKDSSIREFWEAADQYVKTSSPTQAPTLMQVSVAVETALGLKQTEKANSMLRAASQLGITPSQVADNMEGKGPDTIPGRVDKEAAKKVRTMGKNIGKIVRDVVKKVGRNTERLYNAMPSSEDVAKLMQGGNPMLQDAMRMTPMGRGKNDRALAPADSDYFKSGKGPAMGPDPIGNLALAAVAGYVVGKGIYAAYKYFNPDPKTLSKEEQATLELSKKWFKIFEDVQYINENMKQFLEINPGFDVNVPNENGQCAMHLLADKFRPASLNFLISKGANINALDKDGNTPLHHAVMGGNEKAVKDLIQKGANVHIANPNDGRRPVNLAIDLSDQSVSPFTPDFVSEKTPVTKLLEKTEQDFRELVTAAQAGNKEKVLELLTESPYLINYQDQEGNTPLHITAQTQGDNTEMLQFLISNGADLGSQNHAGQTSLEVAQARELTPFQRVMDGVSPSGTDAISPKNVEVLEKAAVEMMKSQQAEAKAQQQLEKALIDKRSLVAELNAKQAEAKAKRQEVAQVAVSGLKDRQRAAEKEEAMSLAADMFMEATEGYNARTAEQQARKAEASKTKEDKDKKRQEVKDKRYQDKTAKRFAAAKLKNPSGELDLPPAADKKGKKASPIKHSDPDAENLKKFRQAKIAANLVKFESQKMSEAVVPEASVANKRSKEVGDKTIIDEKMFTKAKIEAAIVKAQQEARASIAEDKEASVVGKISGIALSPRPTSKVSLREGEAANIQDIMKDKNLDGRDNLKIHMQEFLEKYVGNQEQSIKQFAESYLKSNPVKSDSLAVLGRAMTGRATDADLFKHMVENISKGKEVLEGISEGKVFNAKLHKTPQKTR